jgi:hypothetical protein
MSETISRKLAIDALDKCPCGGKDENGSPWIYKENAVEAIEMVEPSEEPDIIYCKDCRKHNKLLGDYEIPKDGSEGYFIFKPDACPLAEFRGKAREHEFDYQFCAFGERRTE